MSKTTFSGPIKSGPIRSTTGINVQNDIADVTTAWNGVASTAGIGFDDGTVVTATALTSAAGVAGGTIGMNTDNIEPGADAARTNNWLNTGTSKKRIRILSANAGAGVGTLVVQYVQAQSKAFTV